MELSRSSAGKFIAFLFTYLWRVKNRKMSSRELCDVEEVENKKQEQEQEQKADRFVGICSTEDRRMDSYSFALEIDCGNVSSKILCAAAKLRMVFLDQCNASYPEVSRSAQHPAVQKWEKNSTHNRSLSCDSAISAAQ